MQSRWSARIRLRSCRVFGSAPARLMQVAEVVALPSALPAIERYLRARAEFRQLNLLRLSSSELLIRTVEPAPALCLASHRAGAFCTHCRFLNGAGSRDDEPWTVVVPRGSEARPILDVVRRTAGPRTEQDWQVRRFRPSSGLTARQADALDIARRLGYYRFPRRGRLGDVGRALGVSRSTAAELLRRAEAKVVAQSFGSWSSGPEP